MFEIRSKHVRNNKADAGNGRTVQFDADGLAITTDPWAAGFFASMSPRMGYQVSPDPGPTFHAVEDAPIVVEPPPVVEAPTSKTTNVWDDVDRRRGGREDIDADGRPPRVLPDVMAERILDRYTATEVAQIVAILAPPKPEPAPIFAGDLAGVRELPPPAAPPFVGDLASAPELPPPAPAPQSIKPPAPGKKGHKD